MPRNIQYQKRAAPATFSSAAPKHTPAFIAADHSGPVAIISDRLFTTLSDHADRNQLPLSSVVEQLREEIHRS